MSHHLYLGIRSLIALVLATGIVLNATTVPAVAGGPITSEQREAFKTAKELGTVEAWNAYLKSYPSGFYSDLARAYITKIEGGGRPDTPSERQTTQDRTEETTKARQLTCKAGEKLKSEASSKAARVTFENRSGMYRSLQWISGKGAIKDIGGINSGESITVDTFESHVWRISNGPGDCLEIYLPGAGTSTIVLDRLPADDP